MVTRYTRQEREQSKRTRKHIKEATSIVFPLKKFYQLHRHKFYNGSGSDNAIVWMIIGVMVFLTNYQV